MRSFAQRRRRHREDDQDRGRRAERRDLPKRDPQAEQRHRPAQYGFEAEHDAGLEQRALGDGIERDADQQRDHHRGDRKDDRDQGCRRHRGDSDQRRQHHTRQNAAKPRHFAG